MRGRGTAIGSVTVTTLAVLASPAWVSRATPVTGNDILVVGVENGALEYTPTMSVTWSATGYAGSVWDAERLDDGNTLVSVRDLGVVELDPSGTVVWSYPVVWPWDAERLDNGNTLICDRDTERVIEVDPGGAIVWSYPVSSLVYDAERLEDGNTLIVDALGGPPWQVYEVDASGGRAWTLELPQPPTDAERLADGNTLVGISCCPSAVYEYDRAGNIARTVWEGPPSALMEPKDVERLPNGDTLIVAGYTTIYEIDPLGAEVWSMVGADYGLGSLVDIEELKPPPPAAIYRGSHAELGSLPFLATWAPTSVPFDDVGAALGGSDYYYASDAGPVIRLTRSGADVRIELGF